MSRLSLVLNTLMLPERRAVIFASKGVISMALSLFMAMYLQLDRPYWAMVSAIFLQVRPESGLVIEKGFIQIAGSTLGGLFGLMILDVFMPYPLIALTLLALWIALNSGLAAYVHSMNFTYGFAMCGMTAAMVVLLFFSSNTPDSQTAFSIAQARISEICVGTVCAVLVSRLFWPVTVIAGLRMSARTTINKSMQYLALELDPNGSHDGRHQHADSILESVMAMTDDASAVFYEGPKGPARSRAISLLCNRIMSLLSMAQILGRFQRNHPELMSADFSQFLQQLRAGFIRVAEVTDYEQAYLENQQLRRRVLDFGERSDQSPLETRMTQTAAELVTALGLILRAYQALAVPDQQLAGATRLQPHREPLLGAVNAIRSGLVFTVGAVIWMATGSFAAIMMMILPVVFSIMFSRLPGTILKLVFKSLMIGALAAIPVGLLALSILARSSGDYEVLILVLALPYFLGLLLLANRPTLPFGLGFCIPFTIIVRPGPGMSFSADVPVSIGLAILCGIAVLAVIFTLITPPGGKRLQRRLLESTTRDLRDLLNHESPRDWYNGRMGERLLKLSTYDMASGNKDRSMTDLGFTGLNLGHAILTVLHYLKSIPDEEYPANFSRWHSALADAYLDASRGIANEDFDKASRQLLNDLQSTQCPQQTRDLIEGISNRLQLTFKRTAASVNG